MFAIINAKHTYNENPLVFPERLIEIYWGIYGTTPPKIIASSHPRAMSLITDDKLDSSIACEVVPKLGISAPPACSNTLFASFIVISDVLVEIFDSETKTLKFDVVSNLKEDGISAAAAELLTNRIEFSEMMI